MGDRETMLPDHHDEDGADPTGGIHRLLEKVNELMIQLNSLWTKRNENDCLL